MRIKKTVITFMLSAIMVLAYISNCCAASSYLERNDWADDVKTAVNDFIDLYGNKQDSKAYVVSDFDNTASIFDTCEQFIVYQAEVMGYGFTPEELPKILASGLENKDKDLTDLGYGKGSYNDWISDITVAYTYLYNTYGPFKPQGVDEKTAKEIQSDPMWAEFAAKMMNLYCLIGKNESTAISYPWITYWYTGMTEEDVYKLAKKSFAIYRQVDTSIKKIKTSPKISSKVGVTEYTYVNGIQVTENIKELWQKLDAAGIDVWVCSASQCDIIRAAVDEFGLHNYCKGLIGMTPVVVYGKLSNTYDYVSGYCWYADKDGDWHKGNVASKAQTQGIGKVTAVQNICAKAYGCGPLAGFMDSTGDYNFCTEFKNLKLVICFNRADRKVTDGGSVIAELAMYQKNDLGYNLTKANAKDDTYYVLQGRNENGKRTLRNSNKTIRFGSTNDKLYLDSKNEAVYAYISRNKMTTSDVINTFAMKTEENPANNLLGFKYGFLETYGGYHSK